MNTIDRTLKYVDLYLVNNDLDDIKEYTLPDGYRFVLFNDGDEKDWIEIEMSSGEFLTFDEGREAFNHYYGKHYEELRNRCIFIENEKGEKVATSTAFYLENPIDNNITGNVHWVSIKKEYQGQHLSKPLISKTLKQMRSLGHKKTIIHTQTHTWLAVKVYLDMGFAPYKMKEFYLGWQIIKKLTNHIKLSEVSDIEIDEMYNPLYIQSYEYLKNNFREPFIYKVWDEKGKIIGINANGQVYYYKYSFENGKLKVIS
jgi:GNAT superfamily N-acetyltransferase